MVTKLIAGVPMSDEEFLVRTTGGPHDGETRAVPHGVLGWPPPANLPGIFHGGIYILVNFSKLPEKPRSVNLMRGADYEWRELSKG